MEATPAGAWRSFAAAGLCLPAFFALRFLAWAPGGAPDGGLLVGLTAEFIGYVCGWAGFALATLPLAEATGRRAAWPRFIAAWNWANVVQYLVLLLMSVPGLLGLPGLLAHGLGLAALGYALWLEWFVTTRALNISGPRAAVFVVLDMMLGIFIGGLVGRLSALPL